jgi:molecular chaperone DnaK (HSP70)
MASQKRRRCDDSVHESLKTPKVAGSTAGSGWRLVIGLDMGTTYSTAALTSFPSDLADVKNAKIVFVDEYSDEILNYSKRSNNVPTIIVYGNDVECGWAVSRKLEYSADAIHQRPNHYIEGFKLLLDGTKETKDIRAKLMAKAAVLKKEGRIKHEDDIIADYFEWWLQYVRQFAIEKGLEKGVSQPEFVLSVPSAWSVCSFQRWVKACSRAIRKVWPEHSDQRPPKIFTISEPSAAASYYLHEIRHQVEVM